MSVSKKSAAVSCVPIEPELREFIDDVLVPMLHSSRRSTIAAQLGNPVTATALRAAAYARYSTDRQNSSLDARPTRKEPRVRTRTRLAFP
jgi:hypothetical protein